jgi:hypothetical protein
MLVCLAAPALADPPVMDPITTQKIYNAQENAWDYIYSFDYVRDYDHEGPIFDWHVWLGNWTPGVITVTPPTEWSGSWQGGTYGCETNTNPFTWGNMYLGAWKITVKFGYGDGTTTWEFTDNLHNVVGVQPGVLIPLVPEPTSILALGAGLLGLARVVVRRRH